jgi:hypothetical protein
MAQGGKSFQSLDFVASPKMRFCRALSFRAGCDKERKENQSRIDSTVYSPIVFSIRGHPPTLIKGVDDVLIWYLSWMRRSNVPIEL